MKYYMLASDKDISNPIQIERLDGTRQFQEAPNMTVAYYHNEPELEKPDILFSPVPLVSDRMKQLLQIYLPALQVKGIQCYPDREEDKEAIMYWQPDIPKVDCLNAKTEKYPTGMLKHLVIEEDKINGLPILVVDGLLETVLLVSLELTESMLRRRMWGMEFIPVEMKS